MLVDVSAERLVWQPTSFQERYDGSNTLLEREPSRFLDKAIRACAHGPFVMKRFSNNHTEVNNSQYQAGIGFELSGIFEIRNPYLAEDNTTVLCSITKSVGNTTFTVSRGFTANNGTFADGFNVNYQSFSFSNIRSLISEHNYTKMHSVRLYGFTTEVWESKRGVTCVLTRDRIVYLCALVSDNRFVITTAISKKIHNHTNQLGLLGVLIEATGMVVPHLKEKERPIRLLLSMVEKGMSPDEDVVTTVQDLELLAFAILIVAHEEGVNGSMTKLVRRKVLDSQKQVATVSKLVIVPTAMLLIIMVVLLATDFFLRFLILRRSNNELGANLHTIRKLFSHWRVSTSRQWLRARLADDLEQTIHGEYTNSTKLGVKIVQKEEGQYFQLLPGVPVARDRKQMLLGRDNAWCD